MDIFSNAVFLVWDLVEIAYDGFVAFFESVLNIFKIIPDLITLATTYLDLLPDEIKAITILSFGIAFTFALYGLVIKIVLTVVDLLL